MFGLAGTAIGLVASYWHVAAGGGGALALAGHFLGGWKKWALIGLGFAILGAVIFVQHEHNLILAQTIKTDAAKIDDLDHQLARAADDVKAEKAINAANLLEIAKIQADAKAEVDAAIADKDREIAAVKDSFDVKEKIHQAAQKCVAGNVGPYRGLVGWLIDHPDAMSAPPIGNPVDDVPKTVPANP